MAKYGLVGRPYHLPSLGASFLPKLASFLPTATRLGNYGSAMTTYFFCLMDFSSKKSIIVFKYGVYLPPKLATFLPNS